MGGLCESHQTLMALIDRRPNYPVDSAEECVSIDTTTESNCYCRTGSSQRKRTVSLEHVMLLACFARWYDLLIGCFTASGLQAHAASHRKQSGPGFLECPSRCALRKSRKMSRTWLWAVQLWPMANEAHTTYRTWVGRNLVYPFALKLSLRSACPPSHVQPTQTGTSLSRQVVVGLFYSACPTESHQKICLHRGQARSGDGSHNAMIHWRFRLADGISPLFRHPPHQHARRASIPTACLAVDELRRVQAYRAR